MLRDLINSVFDDIINPSPDNERPYQYAVIALAHMMLGALGAALVGYLIAGPVLIAGRLAITLFYWLTKEAGDLRRGGSWFDGLSDTAFVGWGLFYTGSAFWPLGGFLLVIFGTILQAKRTL
jgi:hypothetical protein